MTTPEKMASPFKVDHWFVLISRQEPMDNSKRAQISGLACLTTSAHIELARD